MPNTYIQTYLNDTTIPQESRSNALNYLDTGVSENELESSLRSKYGSKYDVAPKTISESIPSTGLVQSPIAQQINTLKSQGKTDQEINKSVSEGFGPPAGPEKSPAKDLVTKTSMLDRAKGIVEYGNKNIEEAQSSVGEGLTKMVEETGKPDVMPAGTAGFPVLSPQGKEILKGATQMVGGVGQALITPEVAVAGVAKPEIETGLQGWKNTYSKLPEEDKKKIETTLQSVIDKVPEKEFLGDLFWSLGLTSIPGKIELAQGAMKGAEEGYDILKGGANAVKEGAQMTMAKGKGFVEDLMKTPEGSPVSETPIPETAPKPSSSLSIKEQMAGVPEAYKNQLKGKQEVLNPYIESTLKARTDLSAPSPTAMMAQKGEKAMAELERQLNDTGTDIGAFRAKVNTYKATPDAIQPAIDALDASAEKAGFKVDKKGQYTTAKSREPGWKEGEIKALQDYRNKLIDLKGDPKLQRVIDMRKFSDELANFELEPLNPTKKLDYASKKVRSVLAKVIENTVGPEQAKIVNEYADIASLIQDYRKASGGGGNYEFFLKRLLSERDRLAKPIVEAIYNRTGINLLDEVSASKLVTEMLGTKEQQSLLTQEIAKAGIAGSKALKGNLGGLAGYGLQKLEQAILNPEEILRNLGL